MKTAGDILINTFRNHFFHRTKPVFKEGIIWDYWVLYSYLLLQHSRVHNLPGSVSDKGPNKLTKLVTMPSCN